MRTGHATAEGTEKFFRFHPIHADKKRPFTDLWVSALGMGTYLGDSDERTDQMYARSLVSAVSHGINFFDTAANYRSERSEKVVGKVICELDDLGVHRDQLLVATKGGFLSIAENTENFESYVRAHYLEKGIIKPHELVHNCHCISPDFLEHELERSLHNLKLSCIDLYYLHNPEMQGMETNENEFDEKMYKAFAFLEKKVKEKKIRSYGVATWNGFRLKPNAKGLLNLTKLVGFAKKIAGESHHFNALQLPYNMVMLEALKLRNQSLLEEEEEERVNILKAARHYKLNVMVSAPLMQSQLSHLPRRIFDALPAENTPMQKALQFVVSNPFVTTAMVGMKMGAHVQENVKILQEPNWTEQEMKAACKLLGV